MTSPKTTCSKCGTDILAATAGRTGGLCMPCTKGPPELPDPNRPLEVTCGIRSLVEPRPLITTTAQHLLEALARTKPVGDASHPNHQELEAQRALLRHAIVNRPRNFRLHDDHWHRTGSALLDLFEKGRATMLLHDHRYLCSDIVKSEWQDEGTDSLNMHGGFTYSSKDGTLLFKICTWRS